jgi:hypothetical protein
MTTRSDVHSPSNLITENYDYIGCLDTRPREDDGWDGGWSDLVYGRTPEEVDAISTALYHFNGRCTHCSTYIRWAAILQYKPTGEYIFAGLDCLDNRFSRSTADFQRLKKAAELDRQAQRIKGLCRVFAEKNPDLAWMASGDIPEWIRWNNFIVDMSVKLRKYGELSEKQISAARTSIEKARVKHQEYLQRQADREAEKAAAPHANVPTGRINICGVVVSVKEVEDHYAPQSRYSDDVPTTWKMLVQDDRGFRVYGSVPSAFTAYELPGHRISFYAQVEPSQKDPEFGFYRRPTKAEVLES